MITFSEFDVKIEKVGNHNLISLVISESSEVHTLNRVCLNIHIKKLLFLIARMILTITMKLVMLIVSMIKYGELTINQGGG